MDDDISDWNLSDRLRSEMQSLSHCSLIDGGQDTVNLCLANLVLTGAATPWFHNGVISVRSLNADEEEDLEERVGITERFTGKWSTEFPILIQKRHRSADVEQR